MNNKGIKHDFNKLKWGLLPIKAMRLVVKVLMYGAKKYGEDRANPNYKRVDKSKDRYYDATMRHLTDWYYGISTIDKESGINNLAHAISNILFLLELDQETNEN